MAAAGCYDWRPTTISPLELIPTENPHSVRITFRDGTAMRLERATIVNDTIVGYVGPRLARVAPQDLGSFDVPRFNTLKTVAFAATGAAVITAIIAAVIYVQPHYSGF